MAKSASTGGKNENFIIPPPIIPIVKIKTDAAILKKVKCLFTDFNSVGL